MDLPEQRRHLDQKRCRYIPHILLVPEKASLDMVQLRRHLAHHSHGRRGHVNLPFPFPNRVTTRTMSTPGLVHLRCNGGHVWMNAEMMVVRHPYYAVTDESGRFEFTDVPPGTYQIVAWHEGWGLAGKEQALRCADRTQRAAPRVYRSEDLGKASHRQRQPGQHRELRYLK